MRCEDGTYGHKKKAEPEPCPSRHCFKREEEVRYSVGDKLCKKCSGVSKSTCRFSKRRRLTQRRKIVGKHTRLVGKQSNGMKIAERGSGLSMIRRR